MAKVNINIKAPEKHHVLVMAPFAWGKAKTFEEAYKNAVGAGASKKDLQPGNYTVHFIPDEGRPVDDMGRYYYHKDCDICQCLYKPSEELLAKLRAR